MRPWELGRRAIALAAIAGVAMIANGCSDDDNSRLPTDPVELVYDSVMIDASAGWAAIRLGDPAGPATVAGELGESEEWDIAFNATHVMLNGGDAGPGAVSGHCLCQNASATDDQITDMTGASELGAFVAVTDADVPAADDAWQSDAVALAVDGWYSYNSTTHEVSAAPENVWLIRTAGGTAFAKFHVTGIASDVVTFEYAVAPDADAPMGGSESANVTLTDDGSAVYFDFETGATSTTADPAVWDIAFAGYAIHVNGGVNGTGQAAALLTGESYGDVTAVGGVPGSAFTADGFGGVFAESPWYRYDLLGNHHIWPTFNVYLVKRGGAVYKIQVTNYYDVSGDARHITVRYAKLGG